MCGCLSCIPYWGPGLLHRHVSWLSIELVTLCFTDPCSMHWATQANHLWLFISSKSWYGSSLFWQHCMYNFHLPLDGAFIAIGKVGWLGLSYVALLSLLGKLWVCSLASVLPFLVCSSLFPIMCSFWWTSCLTQVQIESLPLWHSPSWYLVLQL